MQMKEVHQLHMWYKTITAVHSIHSAHSYMTQKHLGYRSVKLLQPCFQYLFCLADTSTGISVLGVVVRGAKKHYVNVKTEKTLSTLLVPSTVEV